MSGRIDLPNLGFQRTEGVSESEFAQGAQGVLAVVAINKGRTPYLDSVLVKDYQVPAAQLSAIRLPHYDATH